VKKPKPFLSILGCVAAIALLAGCKEATEAKADKAADQPAVTDNNDRPRIALVPFAAGGGKPEVDKNDIGRKFMNDPEQIAAGKQLFSQMNCNGCHFNGGGGMGPPLLDKALWLYGGSIENIDATIREGRPNGMPSFRGFLPDEQIWQLAAYVHSLSHPVPSKASADDQHAQ
jgi:cytochrome c oxidase cbb3-type subunit III